MGSPNRSAHFTLDYDRFGLSLNPAHRDAHVAHNRLPVLSGIVKHLSISHSRRTYLLETLVANGLDKHSAAYDC